MEAPLISNIDIWRNIALIIQYHRNISERRARDVAIQCLRRYGLEKLADARTKALKEEERFYVMLIRAAMVSDAIIVIDRPLKIVHSLESASYIFDALEKIDDLYTKCHIFDYTWNKGRYGTNYDS